MAPCKRSFTIPCYPSDSELADDPADTPVQSGPAPASSPVFGGASIEPAIRTPSTPTGWGNPVVISGDASINFDDNVGSWTPPESTAPVDMIPTNTVPGAPVHAPAWLAATPESTSNPTPGFGTPKPQRNTTAAPDGLLTGHAAAGATLYERVRREAAVDSAHTHATDSGSASINDESTENSQMTGLAAVLEILGGHVIEEKMTGGGY